LSLAVLRVRHGGGGIVEGDASCAQEGFDVALAETPGREVDEVVLVGKEHQSEDAPHVVLEVGIEEVHAPAAARWREAAQHEYTGAGRQERLQGM